MQHGQGSKSGAFEKDAKLMHGVTSAEFGARSAVAPAGEGLRLCLALVMGSIHGS